MPRTIQLLKQARHAAAAINQSTTNAEYKAFVRLTKRFEPPAWVLNGYNASEEKLQSFKLDTLRWAATQYFKLDMDTQVMPREAILAEL